MRLSRRLLAVYLAAAFLGLSSIGRCESPTSLVIIQKGDLPIVLSAPHGGTQKVPQVEEERKGEGQSKTPGNFVTARDTGTEELVQDVSKAIEQKFGRKPWVVAARFSRKYIDVNRPGDLGYEDPDAKPVYDAYHSALMEACRSVQQKYHKGLLLDLHGQGSSRETVYRGTNNGKTVALLKERFGEQAFTGSESLLGMLKARGWTVYPDPYGGKEQSGFTGGFIVQNYGSHQPYGIDAMQLEFGADYRVKPEDRAKTAEVLASAVAEYSAKYLDLPAGLKATSTVPQSTRVKIGVYKGEGASDSRETVIKVLKKRSGFEVCDVTVDDIKGGKLAELDVLIHPGGSGGGQGKALGEEGRAMEKKFIEAGGGYIGVCAGAYLATCDYEWSLGVLDAKVVDRKHWNRGFGEVKIGLGEKSEGVLGAKAGSSPIYYHQGPLLAPASNPDIPDYEELATFETEIVKNGASPGVMTGCTAIAIGNFKDGRVLCFSPHPEHDSPTEPMLVKAVEWAAAAKKVVK